MKLFLCLFVLAGITLSAIEKTETIEGRLIVRSGAITVLATSGQKQIELDGDAETRKVLRDARLNGFDVHATGHFIAPGKFLLDPQQKRALTVHQHEKEKLITYWCQTCSLRTYSPGPCVCCGAETELDLHDPEN